MNRKEIIQTLVQDIENNFHPGNGYNVQPNKVYRGYYQFEEIKQTPALALTVTGDELIDNLEETMN